MKSETEEKKEMTDEILDASIVSIPSFHLAPDEDHSVQSVESAIRKQLERETESMNRRLEQMDKRLTEDFVRSGESSILRLTKMLKVHSDQLEKHLIQLTQQMDDHLKNMLNDATDPKSDTRNTKNGGPEDEASIFSGFFKHFMF